MDPKMDEKGFIYPLITNGVTKEMVLNYWKSQPFDLEIPDYLGNCTFCWKKSNRKLRIVATEHPEYFKPAVELEPLASFGAGDSPRKMFRGHRSASEILNDVSLIDNAEDAMEGSCAERCEPFGSEAELVEAK